MPAEPIAKPVSPAGFAFLRPETSAGESSFPVFGPFTRDQKIIFGKGLILMNNWYVLHSKPRKEALLRERLRIQRIEVYLPSIRVKPVNPRARKEQPFFPGYLFIHVDLERIPVSELRRIPGATGIVCLGGEPAIVGESLIRTIQHQIESISEPRHQRADPLKSGDWVVINDGPFANYRAMFDCRLPGQARVRVLLELLQGQKVRLELSAKQLQPLTS
jgi:transcriptional antiterminator RfaH